MKMLVEEFDPQHEVALPYIAGEVLVKVRKGTSASLASKLFMQGLIISKKMNLLAGDFIVVQSESKSIYGMMEVLNDFTEVEYVEPNYTNQHSLNKRESTADQNDNTQNRWEKFVVKEAAIEMIDSQIDLKYPQVKPDIKVNSKKIPGFRSGNHVEEITIKDLLFIPDKVPVNLAEAVEAIDYATKRKVDIISNSWIRDGFSRALDEALGVADKRGISFAAAAGIAASIGTSMGALGGNDFVSSLNERRTADHVSAGVLSLYIAHEGQVEKTGRGRLIVKNSPSEEEIENAWNSTSPNQSTGKSVIHNDIKISQDYSFPGAKYIKLEIEKLDSSTNIDLIVLRNADGLIINNISGSGNNYETDYIETNLITVEFTSNATSTSIGSVIRNVKVIY